MVGGAVDEVMTESRARDGGDGAGAVPGAHAEDQQVAGPGEDGALVAVERGVFLARAVGGPEGQVARMFLRHDVRGAQGVIDVGVVHDHVHLAVVAVVAGGDERVALVVQVKPLLEIAGAGVLGPDRGLR